MDDDSKAVLETLEQHEDFMDQLEVIADMGSGAGHHSHWWATRNIDGEKSRQYTILAIDDKVQLDNRNRSPNVRQIRKDYSDTMIQENKLDLIWCHDSFQYATDPYLTLAHWNKILRKDGMLLMSVPQSAYIDDLSRWQVYQHSGCYYSWNMVTLIQALAMNGFDCREGFLRQRRHDKFMWAAVYKSQHAPFDRRSTSWYDLMEKKLLPVSADACVMGMGYLRHEFLDLEWLDHNRYNLGMESIP